MIAKSEMTRPATTFEALEPRLLLSGNVLATVVRGVARITGDKAANAITVSVLEDGAIQVTGQDGTLINGRATPTYLAGDVTGINIDLKNGDDTVIVNGPGTSIPGLLPGNLFIKTGNGDDTVYINGVTVGGKTTIDTGKGDDTVALGTGTRSYGYGPETVFMGAVSIKTGQGCDTLVLGQYYNPLRENGGPSGPSFLGTPIDIHLGSGNDTLTGYTATFEGFGHLNGDGGINSNETGHDETWGNVTLLNFPLGE